MQGDYMALNFAIGMEVSAAHGQDQTENRRDELVVIRRDASNEGTSCACTRARRWRPASNCCACRMSRRAGGGRTCRYRPMPGSSRKGMPSASKARFGEFRVDASGQALLVGMRDDKLAPM
jgi:uncharacterized membrane-anchored protein